MSEAQHIQHPAEVLLARRARRASLKAWCEHVLSEKNETPALHHLLLIETLERVTNGELRKVMILMPPGSAKSTYTSVCFPPWYLARHPQHLILACSYSYSLIEGFGRQCRDLIDRYGNELGYTLSKTAAAAGDWRISKRGGYFCAGVNAGIAGHRADLGFIDDYIGSQEEADSELIRDKNYFWYRNDFVPRLKPTAARIIVANRRHEDDLVGRLMAEEPGEWTIIRLPMLAEDNDILGRKPGEILWPEWFTYDMVAEAKRDSRVWAGLYQQRPSPEEGDYFRRDWLVGYTLDDLASAERSGMRYYVGADYAVRKNKRNDRFCFISAGLDSNDRLWILPDWFWTRADTAEAIDAQIAMAKRRKPICWWAGRENITGAIDPFLQKRMREENCYIPIEELSEGNDKEAKAQSIKGRMSQKMVLFPKFAPDWERAENELLTFPAGTNDDFVDALSKLGQGLAKMTRYYPGAVIVDGPVNVSNWKPSCKWMKGSHARLERQRAAELADN